MSTTCRDEEQTPHASVRIHSPDNGWRPAGHIDKTFGVTAATDSELAARIYTDVLKNMGYTHTPIIIGMLTELVNSLPLELRRVMIIGIAQGWGLKIEPTTDDSGKVTGLNVSNPPTYEPVPLQQPDAEQRTKSGLILPGQSDVPQDLKG